MGFDNTHPIIIIPSNKPTNFHSSGRKPTAPMQRTVNSPNIYKPGIGAASMPGGGPAGNGNNPENNLANEFGKKKQTSNFGASLWPHGASDGKSATTTTTSKV